jgi:type IV pilus assembly protein PilA
MMSKYLQDKRDEEGFTLIELLVVVIIIGILAAIAIPTFLNQRERGYQAELTSGVRNFALEIESISTAANGVSPDALPAVPSGLSADGKIAYTYKKNGTSGFFLCGTTTKIPTANNVSYSTAAGGLQPFAAAAPTLCT